MTCQQLDCMQRHAEGHGHLWQKQAISLNEQQEGLKTDKQAPKEPAAQGAAPTQGAVAIAITTSSDSDEKPSTSGRVAGIAGISGTNAMRYTGRNFLAHLFNYILFILLMTFLVMIS